MDQQKDANKKYCVHIQGYEAVILYPALVTPALVPKGGCLSVILAAKEDFYREHNKDPERKGNKIGGLTARKMHSQLVLTTWGDAAIFNTDEVQYIGQKRQLVSQSNMIFAGHADAVAKYKAGKYCGWYLGQLEEKDFFVKGVLRKNGEETERAWGVLHKAAAKMYRDAGYVHLFQLDFEEFSKSQAHGMYELAFVYFKLYDDDDHEVAAKYDALHEKDGDARPAEDAKGKKLFCCYTDPDDDLVNEYFAAARLHERPKALRTPVKIGAHKLVGSDQMFRLYEPTLNGGKPDAAHPDQCAPGLKTSDTTFLQSRHPVYIPQEWKGKVGAVGDLHVSSRQLLYKRSKAQVIPGADEADSPLLGKIAHVHGASAFTLMDKIAAESDVLAIVGDLYDHVVNCDPMADKFQEVKNAAGVWDAMSYSKYKENWDAYPRGIDGLLLLAKILDIYKHKKRPVLYVSGNHEAYERPYGISPRLRLNDGEAMFARANAGIPADHNLTIYEAVLLHGPESYDLGTKNIKLNFTPENIDWIYCLYTPWKDCVVSYGAEYGFVCLGWGNDEDFLNSTINGGGSLPRAIESCTMQQVQLAQWAADTFQKSALLSHFTLVCYDQLKSLHDTKADVNTDQIAYDPFSGYEQYIRTKYDIGSFKNNREQIFKLITTHKILYSICGHSHRAGAYWHLGVGQTETHGAVSDADIPSPLPRGNGLNTAGISRLGLFNILVCGSAGPYSYQNVSGELGGYGMDLPQGLVLDMPNDSLTWEKDTRVKPRLAVVLEYLWYEGGYSPFSSEVPIENRDIFRYNNKFYFHASKKFLEVFDNQLPFRKMTLFSISSKNTAKLTLTVKGCHVQGGWPHTYEAEPNANDWRVFLSSVNDVNFFGHFLSIKLASVESKYDCDKPWCFPVQVEGSYQHIYRLIGKTGGEVPNFKDYIACQPREYSK